MVIESVCEFRANALKRLEKVAAETSRGTSPPLGLSPRSRMKCAVTLLSKVRCQSTTNLSSISCVLGMEDDDPLQLDGCNKREVTSSCDIDVPEGGVSICRPIKSTLDDEGGVGKERRGRKLSDLLCKSTINNACKEVGDCFALNSQEDRRGDDEDVGSVAFGD